ncbi:MAG: hypothetical protein QG608_2049, partial [Actinomycetota bacterium]|nr:hypothetical protein [Actinomycetota bacterium]
LALATSFLVIAGSWAVYEERARHEAARLPTTDLSAAGGGQSAKVWMEISTDVLHDEMPFVVFSIEPRVADAPLPPGLPRWPEPGEAFVSPQLLKDGAGEQVADRYGKLAGVIGEDGLGVPDERLVWRRPPRGVALDGNITLNFDEFVGLEKATPVGGWGESEYLFSWREFSHAVLGLLTLPALALLYVGNGFGIEERRRRDLLLSTMGASGLQRWWIRIGDVAGPILAGLGVALAGLLAVIWTDPRLPITGFIVPGNYLAAHWSVMGCAVAAAGAGALLFSVFMPIRRTTNSTRPVRRPEGARWGWLLVFPVVLVVAVRLPDLVDPVEGSHGPLWVVTYFVGVGAALITLPFALGVLVGAAGRVLAFWGRSRGKTAALIGGRRLAVGSSGTVRMVTGIVLLVGILLQADLCCSVMTRGDTGSADDRRDPETAVVVLDAQGQNYLAQFLRELPVGAGTVLLQDTTSFASQEGSQLVTGECSDLKALGFSCEGKKKLSEFPSRAQGIVSELSSFWEPPTVTVRSAPIETADHLDSRPSYLLISGAPGTGVELGEIKKIAHHSLADVSSLAYLEDYWSGNGATNAHQSLWIILFGLGTVLTLGTALAVTAATRFREQADALGPVSVLTGGRSLFWGIGGWTVATPMTLAAWSALPVSRFLSVPVTSTTDGPMLSGTLQIAVPGALTVIALLTWAYVSVNTVRQLQDWKPRNT